MVQQEQTCSCVLQQPRFPSLTRVDGRHGEHKNDWDGSSHPPCPSSEFCGIWVDFLYNRAALCPDLLTIVCNRVLVVKVVSFARPSRFAAHKKSSDWVLRWCS
uniref:Uncharacterized protein n=1 Tax=Solanum tuberosum TaxID=4113 RepID=M1D7Z2_SOLTU